MNEQILSHMLGADVAVLESNHDIEMLRKNKIFHDFDINNNESCRIMLEYVCSRHQIKKSELNSARFDDGRFEIGIDGLELRKDGISYYYMPTDAITLSHMGLKSALQTLVKKTPIGKLTNSKSERLEILKNSSDFMEIGLPLSASRFFRFFPPFFRLDMGIIRLK